MKKISLILLGFVPIIVGYLINIMIGSVKSTNFSSTKSTNEKVITTAIHMI